jgi:hypothetical protein
LGSLVRYVVELGQGERVTIQVSSNSTRHDLGPGVMVPVTWSAEKQTILEE